MTFLHFIKKSNIIRIVEYNGIFYSMSKRGYFITFEGADGCGKTTQAELIKKYLDDKNVENILTREPGGSELGVHLRKILLHYEKPVSNIAETFLYLADRAQHIEYKIKPALEEGKIVLCDRHTDSTLAYQGYGRNQDLETIKRLNNIAINGILPDLTIVFDVDSETAQKRLKGEKDRLEAEGMEFHKKLRAGYLDIAKHEPKRVKVVDANQDIEQVFNDTIKIIREFLNL